ncbi:MAG TPA: hypothetical protein VN442_19235 [Bryobacteraceae bacterium]|nr:hypothetical protein [Bryobacteraceae bacterium]
MTAAPCVLLMVVFGTSALAESSGNDDAPSYTASSIVNSTTNQPGPFAPNTIVTIYGSRLANGEQAATEETIQEYRLPLRLARVQVLDRRGGLGVPLPLHYVGPEQINFLLPDSLDPGDVYVSVSREGRAGPVVRITVQEAAPALFPYDGGTVIATHLDGSLITPASSARPGEVVVLYCTGLGRTAQRLHDGELPDVPRVPLAGLMLKDLNALKVLLNGEPVHHARILYAGLTPGIAALYQINLLLPDDAPADPEVRLTIGKNLSMEGLKLPLQP